MLIVNKIIKSTIENSVHVMYFSPAFFNSRKNVKVILGHFLHNFLKYVTSTWTKLIKFSFEI